MIHRRPPAHAAAQKSAMSGFDRFTFHAFALAVTAATAAALAYGPAAALHHIADVLAGLGTLPLPDEAAWGGQMIF